MSRVLKQDQGMLKTRIDLTDFRSGQYVMRIIADVGVYTQRMVIQ